MNELIFFGQMASISKSILFSGHVVSRYIEINYINMIFTKEKLDKLHIQALLDECKMVD